MEKRNSFLIYTCILSAIISILYTWKAMQEGFCTSAFLIIGANISYIIGSIIFKYKFFTYWSIAYSCILLYTINNSPTKLFNNFTSLFVILIAIILKPQLKKRLIILYITAVSIVFIINQDCIYNYLIHITRAAWLFFILDYSMQSKYERKPLDLTEDEIMILEELSEKKLLKACTCFSKNTLTQKLKDARERNNIDTNAELLSEYKRK